MMRNNFEWFSFIYLDFIIIFMSYFEHHTLF